MLELDELRAVSAADVYKGDVRAATLERSSGGTVLRYRDEYDGPPLAHALPLGAEVRTVGGALAPFFANLLPEGRRLQALRSQVKTSADDEFSMLLAVGSDTIGDVRVVPAGTVPDAAPPLLPDDTSADDVSFAEVLRQAGFIDRVAIPGIQDKLSGGMITLPARWGARPVLVKLDPPDFPHAVVNEDFFLHVARGLRQPVVDATVLRDRDDRAGLVVARFDRAIDGSRVDRFAVEDACQLLNRYPADKYAVSAEEVLAAVGAACPARPVALRAAFQQFVLAWLTGNGDLHAKNIAVLNREREWKVAPIYDIPSTLMWGDDSMALPIGGKVRGLSRRSFIALGLEVGLPRRAVERAVDDVLTATSNLVPNLRAGKLEVDQNTATTLARRLVARRRALEAA